jgi:RNA polymerase sigma factor (sigma-70 family)
MTHGAGSENPADDVLLGRFVASADARAFRGIVVRHGPLVLRVCRVILRDSHDAEDAFQATFLVLVKDANKIRRRASLASWLQGTAYRVANRGSGDDLQQARQDSG